MPSETFRYYLIFCSSASPQNWNQIWLFDAAKMDLSQSGHGSVKVKLDLYFHDILKFQDFFYGLIRAKFSFDIILLR